MRCCCPANMTCSAVSVELGRLVGSSDLTEIERKCRSPCTTCATNGMPKLNKGTPKAR